MRGGAPRRNRHPAGGDRASLTHGSLFTGYGGLDLAVNAAFGSETIWTSDINPGAGRIIASRFPVVPNLGDITQVDWSTVRRPSILSGGSPCQDLSTAGARAGMVDGTRSNLWVAMREAIAHLEPTYVVWENVRGALSARAESNLGWTEGLLDGRPQEALPKKEDPALRALGRVLGDLADLGYDARWVCLRASDVGACHRRERVFVLAHPKGHQWRECVGDQRPARLSAPRRLLPTVKATNNENRQGPGCSPNLGEALRLLPTPRTSDTNGAGVHGQGGLDLRTAVTLLPTPMTTDGKGTGPADLNWHSPQLRALPKLLPTPTAARFNDGEDLASWSARRARVKETASNGNGFGTPLSVAVRLGSFGEYGPAIDRHERIFARTAPSPTEPGKNGGARLAARFAEWMMCLPDGWVTDPAIWEGMTDTAARSAQLHALGNGVVPPQAYAALSFLLGKA